MPAPLALPIKKFIPTKGRLNVTFVLPAPDGCDLACAGCFIRARQEHDLAELTLTPDDYVNFVRASASDFDLRCVSLQGYEPLLRGTRPFTDAILRAAQELGIPSFLVTNGTHLLEAIDTLAAFDVKGLTISLDSADPIQHDLSRGTVGAYRKTMEGIRAASVHPLLSERTLIASILQPRRYHYLRAIPALLADLGLRYWVVTPMLNPRRASSVFTESAQKFIPELQELNLLAKQAGVELLVDDEFNNFTLDGASENVLPLRALQIRRLPNLQETIRLTPSGHVSVGTGILRALDKTGPQWSPSGEGPTEFLRKLLSLN